MKIAILVGLLSANEQKASGTPAGAFSLLSLSVTNLRYGFFGSTSAPSTFYLALAAPTGRVFSFIELCRTEPNCCSFTKIQRLLWRSAFVKTEEAECGNSTHLIPSQSP